MRRQLAQKSEHPQLFRKIRDNEFAVIDEDQVTDDHITCHFDTEDEAM